MTMLEIWWCRRRHNPVWTFENEQFRLESYDSRMTMDEFLELVRAVAA